MGNFGKGLSSKSSPKELVVKDIQRQVYDMSHFSFVTGAIGSLQTLSCIPVVAGETWDIDLRGVFRLSPLRRPAYLDVRVDLFAFSLPHRQVYGQTNWTDFIKQGFDEAVTLGSDTMTADSYCTGTRLIGGTAYPKWNVEGLPIIWNYYFRDPSNTAAISVTYLTGLAAGNKVLMYGLPCAHLMRMWNTPLADGLTSGDYSLPLSGGEVNLYEFQALQTRLKTETARNWYAIDRYADVMQYAWQSTVNTDADPRPELVMHSVEWLSSQDVNGTDDATLGNLISKSVGVCALRVPHYYIREHGALWLLALLRFPPVLQYGRHYLLNKAEPTYLQIAGDPELIAGQKPIQLTIGDINSQASSTALGLIPYGQWYREQTDFVHSDYLTSAGHPFILPAITAVSELVTITHDAYDSVFQTIQMKHWQAQCHIMASKKSFIPPAESSMFAGTR